MASSPSVSHPRSTTSLASTPSRGRVDLVELSAGRPGWSIPGLDDGGTIRVAVLDHLAICGIHCDPAGSPRVTSPAIIAEWQTRRSFGTRSSRPSGPSWRRSSANDLAPRSSRRPSGGAREFDAVSEDHAVVISIKTSSGLTSGGKVPSGKINGCVADLYYLSLLDAPVRRLVLTNPEFHQIFIKRMAGALPKGVEVKLIPLTPDLQAEVDRVIREASREIDRGKFVQVVAAAIEEEVEGAQGGGP